MSTVMNTPKYDASGACVDCYGGWMCAYHQADGLRRDRAKVLALSGLSESIRRGKLARIASRFELESDEGGTALEKAARMVSRGECVA